MDRRRLRTAHYVEGDGLVGVAPEAADLQISVTRVQGVADCRRRLGRSLVAEHPVIPDFKGEPVGHLARRLVDADNSPCLPPMNTASNGSHTAARPFPPVGIFRSVNSGASKTAF